MADQNGSVQSHPFPPKRPDIKISESVEKIDQIDCLELQWWFAVPRLGDHTMSAFYEADTLELSAVTDMVVTAPARIHQVDCMEVQVNEWSAWKDWPLAFDPGFIYGKIGQDETRWIAVIKKREGAKVFSTFVDEGFEDDWGECEKRKLYDDGRYQLQGDGSYKITDGKGLGAGVYDVTIEENKFCCLRVLDPGPSVSEYGELSEAYVERGGRTVLYRQYRGRLCGVDEIDWAQKYPNNPRIVINGCMYVHCDCTGRAHDVITNTSLAIHTAK